MKPIILIIVLAAAGSWSLQYLRAPAHQEKPVSFRELKTKIPAPAELLRWQW